jgi:hypothetical protein
MQFQKASYVAEITQDSFTMVDQTKSYAAIVACMYAATNACKSTPEQTHQKVASRSNDTDTTRRSVTIKGVLTMAIDNQQVMQTKVTLPVMEMERCKALIKTLDQLKLHKAMYKAFRVKAPELPMATNVTQHMQNLTKDSLTMKKSPEETPAVIWTTMMCISNQKPSKHTGHHVIP